MVKKIKSPFFRLLVEGPEGLDVKGEPSLRGDYEHHVKARDWWRPRLNAVKDDLDNVIPTDADWLYAYHDLMVFVTHPDSQNTKKVVKRCLAKASHAMIKAFEYRNIRDSVEEGTGNPANVKGSVEGGNGG